MGWVSSAETPVAAISASSAQVPVGPRNPIFLLPVSIIDVSARARTPGQLLVLYTHCFLKHLDLLGRQLLPAVAKTYFLGIDPRVIPGLYGADNDTRELGIQQCHGRTLHSAEIVVSVIMKDTAMGKTVIEPFTRLPQFFGKICKVVREPGDALLNRPGMGDNIPFQAFSHNNLLIIPVAP